MIQKLSHVAIAVPDIAQAIELYHDKFGVSFGPVVENPQQKVRLAYADLGNARLEIIEPMSKDSPLTAFLRRNPKGGLHHVAFNVENLGKSLTAMMETGIRVVGKPGTSVHGDPIAFLHPADLLGTLVELEERHKR
jgi:methylmalonyl-CoA/ethylmalonyl-CoA epimerase